MYCISLHVNIIVQYIDIKRKKSQKTFLLKFVELTTQLVVAQDQLGYVW